MPGDEAVRQRPPPFGSRQHEGCTSPPGATARSALAPTRSNRTPRNTYRDKGHLDTHVLPGADDSPRPYSAVGPGAVPRTSRSEGDGVARPVTCSAAIPSAMCTMAGGVAATCVSPRSNCRGWARQLEVVTQYLNHSLVVPTRPQRHTFSSNSGRERPATAEAVRAGGRGFLVESGCNNGISCPQTPAGPRERMRNHPHLDGRSHSSVEGGDCRYCDTLATSGLSSRPLSSTRTAVGASGSPSGRSSRRPVVVASPRIEQPTKKTIARNSSSFKFEEPPGAQANPLFSSSRRGNAANGFVNGVNLIGEVGYTISSATAVGDLAPEENGHNCTPRGATRSRFQKGPLNESELVTSPSSAKVGDHRWATTAVTAAEVPKLQLGRLPGHLEAKRQHVPPS